MKFRKGTLKGELRETWNEHGANYKWLPCLALLSEEGRWLCSTHWRRNAPRKAERELIALGWKKVEEEN